MCVYIASRETTTQPIRALVIWSKFDDNNNIYLVSSVSCIAKYINTEIMFNKNNK